MTTSAIRKKASKAIKGRAGLLDHHAKCGKCDSTFTLTIIETLVEECEVTPEKG